MLWLRSKPSLGESAAELRQTGAVETSPGKDAPLPKTGRLAKGKPASCPAQAPARLKSYRGWPHPVNQERPQPLRQPLRQHTSPQPRRSGAKGRLSSAHVAISHTAKSAPRAWLRAFGPPTRAKRTHRCSAKARSRPRLKSEPARRRAPASTSGPSSKKRYEA